MLRGGDGCEGQYTLVAGFACVRGNVLDETRRYVVPSSEMDQRSSRYSDEATRSGMGSGSGWFQQISRVSQLGRGSGRPGRVCPHAHVLNAGSVLGEGCMAHLRQGWERGAPERDICDTNAA